MADGPGLRSETAPRRTSLALLVSVNVALAVPRAIEWAEDSRVSAQLYVFIGLAERRMRGDLADLLLRDPLPDWLEVAAQGEHGGAWRLMRFADRRAADSGR